MTKVEKFNTYYRPWFFAMIVIFGLKFLTGLSDEEQKKRVTSIEGLLLLFGLIIGTSLFCGGIYHWFYEVHRPKRLAQLFNKIRHFDLQELGFILNETDNNFSGHYKDYFLTIFIDSNLDFGDFVRINAFIVPEEKQEKLYLRLSKELELNTNNELVWFTKKTKFKLWRTLKIETLKKDINNLVDLLSKEKVKPLIVTDDN